MRIRICCQPAGAVDGIPQEQFRAGQVYDVDERVARVFLEQGWAESADARASAAANHDAQRVAALVLVVDDDTDLRTLTATVLACNGYAVVEARHGREGLARLMQDNPELVLLDLNMPVMNGWEFRAEQQRLTDMRLASVPVLLLTGEDGAEAHTATLKAVGLVGKPFEPERLLAAIGAALGRPGAA